MDIAIQAVKLYHMVSPGRSIMGWISSGSIMWMPGLKIG